MVLLDAPLGRDILYFKGYYFVRPKLLLLAKQDWIFRPRFKFFLGLIVPVLSVLKNGARLNHLLWKVLLPNPLFVFQWGRIAIPSQHKELLFESYDPNIDPIKADIFKSEEELIGAVEKINGVLTENTMQHRIRYLISNRLIFLEEKEDGKNKLFRDPNDDRLWQLSPAGDNWFGGGSLKLTHVNRSKWDYDFIRKQSNRGNFENRDKEFFENLEIDEIKEACEVEGCNEFKVRFSSLCCNHHFESITGRKYQPE